MPVLRHTMSPWYLSEKLYPPNVFPTYCSGSTVIFRSSILRPLYNASFELPFLSVDDALVTGEMARIAGVGHVSLNRYYSFAGDQWKKVVKGEIIFGHIHGERARVRGWKAVVKELLAKRKIVPKVSDTNDVSKSLRTWSLVEFRARERKAGEQEAEGFLETRGGNIPLAPAVRLLPPPPPSFPTP
ncbi:hypothetical protein HPB47_004549 [Ixodes persulcatus]|uniref:Uncharacterized protein n=1 Tax=Ixodes persulcatus TaxID=34615 RepID=A0AC60PFN5_IXOPE|nr:hypothetical protein HPB47_004549 [Ixodes persulcatus]